MRQFFLILLFFQSAAYLQVQAQPADSLMQRVRAKLAAVKDYRATATLRVDVPFMKLPASAVTVYFSQPDHLEIRQEKGISVIPKGGFSSNLNSLTEEGKYAAVAVGKTSLDNHEVQIVKLLPLDEGSQVVVSTLYIDPISCLVVKFTSTTRDNGTYDMLLRYGRYAKWGLPDEVALEFDTRDYKLPKGLAFDYDSGENTDPSQKGNGKGRVTISYSYYIINKGMGKLDKR